MNHLARRHSLIKITDTSLLFDDVSVDNLFSVNRRLRTAYTGDLIRLRRSSDDAESDFGFGANNLLDQSAITSWAGSDDLYVVTIYDQSGNGNNASNTIDAKQARFYLDCSTVDANAPALPGLKTTAGTDVQKSYRITDVSIGTGEYVHNNVLYNQSGSVYNWSLYNSFRGTAAHPNLTMTGRRLRVGSQNAIFSPEFDVDTLTAVSAFAAYRDSDDDIYALHNGGTPNSPKGAEQEYQSNPVTDNLGNSQCWIGILSDAFYFEGFAGRDFTAFTLEKLRTVTKNQIEFYRV